MGKVFAHKREDRIQVPTPPQRPSLGVGRSKASAGEEKAGRSRELTD